MAITIFNAALTGAFVASTPFMLKGKDETIDFRLVVGVTGNIEWFLEFAGEDPNAAGTRWYRETAEEDASGGVVAMPKAVRRFYENGAPLVNLAAGTHDVTVQLQRSHQFGRLKARLDLVAIPAAVASMEAIARFGFVARTPAP